MLRWRRLVRVTATSTVSVILLGLTNALPGCAEFAWGKEVPANMQQREELMSLLADYTHAQCLCSFPDKVLARLTAGGGVTRPTRAEAERYCAGDSRLVNVNGDDSGEGVLMVLRSSKNSLYEGKKVLVSLVFVENRWQAYLPQSLPDRPE